MCGFGEGQGWGSGGGGVGYGRRDMVFGVLILTFYFHRIFLPYILYHYHGLLIQVITIRCKLKYK